MALNIPKFTSILVNMVCHYDTQCAKMAHFPLATYKFMSIAKCIMCRILGQICFNKHMHAWVYMLRPDSQPWPPLRSRSTGFEAGQRIQFQSRSDLNWLAVLTESVYKLELHATTVIGTTLRWQPETLTLGYSENLESDYTRQWREAILSLECTFKARAIDCIEDSCAE